MRTPTHVVRIGAGAGFADDRIQPAVDLAEQGELDYLVFECLAERTVARENLTRKKNPKLGYNPRLAERMTAVLPACIRNGTRIVTNMGSANPTAAAHEVLRVARSLGLGNVTCAAVTGDDVADLVRSNPQLALMETGEPVETLLPRMASANAYLGADVIVKALATDAQVVITGRVADPSLFLAAAMHHFGWSYDDLALMAAGTTMGHLLECAAQVTGGCFADPGKKDVHDLAGLGFPIAEMGSGGSLSIGKLASSGGRVDLATCKEQLLYEMHDPASYITPDCVLDITDVDLVASGHDLVSVLGAKARARTDTYKVSVGYMDGYIGEGQISYAGVNAVARARLAADVLQARLRDGGHRYSETRIDLIGLTSLHGTAGAPQEQEPYEVRLRVASRTDDRRAAEAVGFEMRALHVNGPSGGAGGSDPVVREVLAVQSLLVPRVLVDPNVRIEEMK